ncbi:MAG: helix-turn-helix domain-containing protein, partial [Planctomycetes bacterium]|nr:helix-turn-helix domain-containing protein [Planctomycetota bacterium]
ETIKDDVRFAVARELLSLTSLPIGDIATTLDFASPSAVIHAFQRWSGTSPTTWRQGQNAVHGTASLVRPLP